MIEKYISNPLQSSRILKFNADSSNPKGNWSAIPTFFYEFRNDPTIIPINASVLISLDGIEYSVSPIKKIREHLIKNANETSKILFENLYEGYWKSIVNYIYIIIEGINISPEQCYLFSGGLNVHELYDDYMKDRPNLKRIKIYSGNLWEASLHHSCPYKILEYNIKPKEKTFLCFNRIVRIHRTALLGLLYSKDLIKDSFYSYFPDASYGDIIPTKDIFYRLGEHLSPDVLDIIEENYFKNLDNYPLKLNIDWRDNVNYIRGDDMNLFNESYFSLVTETLFFGITTGENCKHDWDSIFFSEKIYKPISMKHPFILVSRPHSLKYLRKLGYKTFSPFIDESYDDIENDQRRLIAIVNEVERLTKNTLEQWLEWQHNIKSIIEYNHSVFSNRKHYQYAFKRPDYETQY